MSIGEEKGDDQVSETSDELRWRMQLVITHAATTGKPINESAEEFNQALRQLQSGETQEVEN